MASSQPSTSTGRLSTPPPQTVIRNENLDDILAEQLIVDLVSDIPNFADLVQTYADRPRSTQSSPPPQPPPPVPPRRGRPRQRNGATGGARRGAPAQRRAAPTQRRRPRTMSVPPLRRRSSGGDAPDDDDGFFDRMNAPGQNEYNEPFRYFTRRDGRRPKAVVEYRTVVVTYSDSDRPTVHRASRRRTIDPL